MDVALSWQKKVVFSFLLSLAVTAQTPGYDIFEPGRTAIIFSTIEHSEWCPAGNVRIDLVTGEFALTPRAPREVCQNAGLERSSKSGRLDTARLEEVRRAYLNAQSAGLDICIDDFIPESIIVSNGGTPILALTSGAYTLAAPEKLQCWSDEANKLDRTLNEIFGAS